MGDIRERRANSETKTIPGFRCRSIQAARLIRHLLGRPPAGRSVSGDERPAAEVETKVYAGFDDMEVLVNVVGAGLDK